MLDARLKTQLQSYLQNLSSSVELVLALDESNKSKELETLALEIAELSSQISVSRDSDHFARKPSMLVKSVKTGSEIQFAGVPMGHEFNSLVLAKDRPEKLIRKTPLMCWWWVVDPLELPLLFILPAKVFAPVLWLTGLVDRFWIQSELKISFQ